jgi:hypothetical protein
VSEVESGAAQRVPQYRLYYAGEGNDERRRPLSQQRLKV